VMKQRMCGTDVNRYSIVDRQVLVYTRCEESLNNVVDNLCVYTCI
jgi:hypothetical protein